MSFRSAFALWRLADEAKSMTHHDVASYERDLRPGAVLLDPTGRVLATRVASPTRGTSIWSRPLPVGHPRIDEDPAQSSKALRRDREASPWR